MRLSWSALSGLVHKPFAWNATRRENARKHLKRVLRVEEIFNNGQRAYRELKWGAVYETRRVNGARLPADAAALADKYKTYMASQGLASFLPQAPKPQ